MVASNLLTRITGTSLAEALRRTVLVPPPIIEVSTLTYARCLRSLRGLVGSVEHVHCGARIR